MPIKTVLLLPFFLKDPVDPVDREGRKGLAWDGLSGVGPCPPILGTGVPRSPKNSLAQEDPVTNANSYTLSNIFCLSF